MWYGGSVRSLRTAGYTWDWFLEGMLSIKFTRPPEISIFRWRAMHRQYEQWIANDNTHELHRLQPGPLD